MTSVMNIPFERRSNVLILWATDNLLNTDSVPWVVVVHNIIIIIIIIIIFITSSWSPDPSVSCTHLMWFLMYSPLSTCLSPCQITWHCRAMTVLQGGRAIREVPPSVCSCRGNFSSFWCEVLQKEVSASKLIPGAPSQIRSENFIWL